MKARHHSSGGFTLIELLIGTAVVVFMVAMLGQILSTTQGIWRTSEARTDQFRDSRAALEMISRQIALAVTNDKAPALALENIYTQTNDTKDGPANNQQVYALVPMANSTKSDVCAVGFYCTWNSTKHAYILRRHFMESDSTYARLQSAGLPGAAGPVAAGAVFTPASPQKSPNLDEDLAAYVWNLKVVPYEYSGGLIANNTYPLKYNATLPQFLEISFNAMSPQAAIKLAAQNVLTSTWFDPSATIYKLEILPQTHVFKTRIKLHNAIEP